MTVDRSSLAIDDLDVMAPGAFAAAREIAQAMPLDERLELIDAHPHLGAPPATVSALSHTEQGYDARTPATEGGADAEVLEARRVADELGRLNDAYEARFGFRY